MRGNACRLVLAGFAVAALATCSRSPTATFYTLTEIAPAAVAGKAAAYEVLIGPVTMPAMLDRPQLVTRASDDRVRILEMQRWAAPLKSEIPRVVAANLNQLLDDAAVMAEPQPATGRQRLRIAIEIQRLDATPGRDVAIEAIWSIQASSGAEPKIGYSVLRQPVSGPGYDALVAAHGGAVAALSRELADATRAVRSAPEVPAPSSR